MSRVITRTVWILSLVSLFTDMASEMLYPIIPLYLESIGFSVFAIGLLEGLAEATAGLSKGYFGKLSDSMGRRMPFVQIGYSLSAISKPMMAAFITPVWVFLSRTLDRLGKGIRTGARDALLSDEATSQTKGKVFGFHRALDTLGAVIGPLLAMLYLHFNKGNYRSLFFIAFAPGLLAVLSSLLLKEKKQVPVKSSKRISFFDFVRYWKQSSSAYKDLTMGLLLFTLFNSSDVFLLLQLKETGFDGEQVIFAYVFYNLVYAIFSYPMGILADKFSFKKVLITGLFVYALVYAGIGIANSLYQVMIIFFLYGVYAAGTEGISKAWITSLCKKQDTATAIGSYTAFQSICAMIASALAGFIWWRLGAIVTFVSSALMAILVAVYFMFSKHLKSSG